MGGHSKYPSTAERNRAGFPIDAPPGPIGCSFFLWCGVLWYGRYRVGLVCVCVLSVAGAADEDVCLSLSSLVVSALFVVSQKMGNKRVDAPRRLDYITNGSCCCGTSCEHVLF